MAGTISSRTPEGRPDRCPACGTLLWFVAGTGPGEVRYFEAAAVRPLIDRVAAALADRGLALDEFARGGAELDSLGLVELVMELEDELGLSLEPEPNGSGEDVPDLADAIARLLERYRDERGGGRDPSPG